MSNLIINQGKQRQEEEQQINDGVRSAILRSIEMNETGIQYMNKNQFHSAIGQFGSALTTLNQVLSSQSSLQQQQQPKEDDETESTDDDQQMADVVGPVQEQEEQMTVSSYCDDENNNNNTMVISNNDQATVVVDPVVVVDDDDDDDGDNGFSMDDLTRHRASIYTTPIDMDKFLSLTRPSSSMSYVNIVEMSISVMFNFALAHHLSATSGDVEDPIRVFDQAIALYELTHSLQLQEGIELSVEYTMATICNLGHIHRFLGDMDKSSKCFQHLLSIFFFLQSQNAVDEHHGTNYNSSTESPADATDDVSSLRKLLDTDVFFHSVSHLLLSNSAAAAA
jgi:hypothetical protein